MIEVIQDSETVSELIALFRQREALGRTKYGDTVDRTDLTHREWLLHALLESMDHCLYLMAAIRTVPEP